MALQPAGHFFNSLHLWSVELFMALLVIHLWGKFWMAAWRGRRTWTWITGVVAFVASVVECFTGYLSQQNFDSQWISASGKDVLNSVGAGAFFNVMNFGQMLMWHIVLIPIVLIAIVGAHILLVRVHGVSHPINAPPPRYGGRAATAASSRGGRRRPVARPEPPLRHPQGGDHRRGGGGGGGADPGPGRGTVLPGRAAGHGRDLGQGRPGRLPGQGGERAERDQRDRYLRLAVEQPERQRPEAAVLPADHPGPGR